MKAISLWQPWASLMAAGIKTIETRHWPTGYRGPLAIHAAKRPLGAEEKELLREWLDRNLIPWGWYWPQKGFNTQRYDNVPFGAIIAVVDLIDCCLTDDLEKCWYVSWFNKKEQAFGNYAPGRWAWITKNPRTIDPPIPYRGRQGLFEIPDSILGTEYDLLFL